MKRKLVGIICCVAILGLSATVVRAVEEDEAPRKPRKVVKPVKKTDVKKKSKVPLSKLVDINAASKAELKKLPTITDELADKIIAGRPYASKAWLVTNKVVPEANYEAIRGLIAVKNPQAALQQLQQQKGGQKK
ncbi:ComEA family DNA-binding protein [Trichlorobacter ammonificans]|uniref:Helix-hairpin-helix domain-containing protein n=1 Tax=Trichlorobacter ammonificans TaxID=2916410 RepID=A0ABM9DBK8_9BACT|nr:helix-hairpin-helix domain-containing protein [Trichlorobacter ammonificans]CAH2031777.1 conserved exported protein of unknown function [Trichlorobacter ammonificans]